MSLLAFPFLYLPSPLDSPCGAGQGLSPGQGAAGHASWIPSRFCECGAVLGGVLWCREHRVIGGRGVCRFRSQKSSYKTVS